MPLLNRDCYKSIKFSMSDLDGSLRLKKFGVNEIGACDTVLLKLGKYLQRIPFKDIRISK